MRVPDINLLPDPGSQPDETSIAMAKAVERQYDYPTKKFTVPTEEGGKAEFEYSDFMGGMDERQRRLMDPKRKPDLKEPELTPSEAETIPGRRITSNDLFQRGQWNQRWEEVQPLKDARPPRKGEEFIDHQKFRWYRQKKAPETGPLVS